MPWRASSVANIESAPPIARTSGASCSSRSNSRGGLLDIDCSDQIKRLPFRTYRGKCYPLPIIRQPIIRKHRQGSPRRSEEHTSELQSLMRISYADFCLKNKKNTQTHSQYSINNQI